MILIKNSHLPKHSQNSRMRAKFVLRDIRFMILNLKDNFADYNVLKKSPIVKKLDFANHSYLCKGLKL
jgi:hypothetical protein